MSGAGGTGQPMERDRDVPTLELQVCVQAHPHKLRGQEDEGGHLT